MTTEPLLSVTGIETYYGQIQAIRGISLEVEVGQIVTVLGANGAGKTTVLRTVSGVLNPARGQVRFQGRDIAGLSPLLISQILDIIRRINREHGVAILLVEQNANIALNTADYGHILEVGRIVVRGTCAELREKEDIKEFYLGQKAEGVRGTTGAILADTHPEWLEADLALQSAGGTSAGLSPIAGVEEITHQLRDSGARLVFAENLEQRARHSAALSFST
jgi:ABC-type branched-subunit amino acid transport system ATPase component